MHHNSERHKLFNRRTAMLAGGKMALLSALVARMYYLQVVEAEKYRTLADENRINLRLLLPPRGRIVDRFDVTIADNQQNYRVLLISEEARDVDRTLDILGRIIPLGQGERRRVNREMRRNRSFVPVTIRENLNWEEVARIEVNAPDLPGVMIDVGQSRYYPYGTDIAHVLGYVAAVSQKELTGDPLLELPGFRIGKAGIEKVHDLVLRGSGGTLQVEVNAFGRVIRELSRQEGQPGAEIRLTIDLGLQRMINKRLAGDNSAVVALDVHSGDVLAMTSTPGYDPNAFNTGFSTEEWLDLVSNPHSPLHNKAVAGYYAPGSTFKMVVLLAALVKGVITPETEVFCSGSIELGDAEFHCWRKGGHGLVAAKKGLVESCDVYFYEIARRTGIERIAAMARRLGLGAPLGLDLPGEKPGLIPTREWKRAALDAPWHQGETLLTGIGQGYVLTTPLQLAVMTARLVNGGFAVVPRLTRSVSGNAALQIPEEETGFTTINIAPQHFALIKDALADVVNSPFGTAFRARIDKPGIEMGGKTGTVQVRRISKAEREQGIRKNKDLPWKKRDHALFVGFAPVDSPRYVVSVVIEHGGSGSGIAAPIARDILLEVQRRHAAAPSAGRKSVGLKPTAAENEG